MSFQQSSHVSVDVRDNNLCPRPHSATPDAAGPALCLIDDDKRFSHMATVQGLTRGRQDMCPRHCVSVADRLRRPGDFYSLIDNFIERMNLTSAE